MSGVGGCGSVSFEEVACVDLVVDVLELGVPPVGEDEVAAVGEVGVVVGDH